MENRGRVPEPLKILQRSRDSHYIVNEIRALGFLAVGKDSTKYLNFWNKSKSPKADALPLFWLYNLPTFIGGVSGKGKSNTAEVILLNFCENDLPFSIIDEENEFKVLADKFDVVRISSTKLVGNEELIKKIATTAVMQRKRVIIHWSPTTSRYERCFIVLKYTTYLYDICDKEKIPHFLYIDEARMYIPQKKDKASKINVIQAQIITMMTTVTTSGRKRGLTLMIATQSIRDVDKGPLRQVEICILHGVNWSTDIDAYLDILRRSEDTEMRKWAYTYLPQFKKGEVCVIYGHFMVRGMVRYLDWHVSVTPDPYKKPTEKQLTRQTHNMIDLEMI